MLSCYSDRTGGTRSEGPTTRAKQVNTEAGCHTGFRSAVFHSARVQCSASSIQQLFVDSLTVSNKTLVRLQIRLQCQIQTQSCRFISIPFFNGRLPKCSNQLNFFDQGQRWCFSKEKKKKDKNWNSFLPYPNCWVCFLEDFLGKKPFPKDSQKHFCGRNRMHPHH